MNSKISKTPREVVQELDQFIVGQASAKRALAVALRNRYRRLLLDEEMQKEVTPKNLLMIGPTGVGKTELARRLAKLVDAPFVKVEATKFTEVGYVGRDVESMVRDLVENAISIVQKQKQEDVRPQAYDKAVRKLAKILKPGIMKKVANPQQDSLMNLFQSMGLPKTDLPQEEKEEVTEEIAASRREIEQQLRNGLLKNQEVTIEVEEKPLRMAGNSNGMEQMMQIQSMLDQMTPKKRSKRTVSVEEALDAKVVEEIIVSESFEEYNIVDSFEGDLIKVTDSVLKSISDTITSQGIIALCRIEKKELDINNYSKVLILDKIQDPGNLGTIIRTADAFNFDCIILGKGTTSLYGQKVVRSTQGSNFHIDCFDNMDLVELIDEMHEFNIFATSLKADKYIEQLDNITGKVAVVFGNEGAGVSEEILSKVNNLLKISMPGRAESLNVSIAAGIVMHYISTK